MYFKIYATHFPYVSIASVQNTVAYRRRFCISDSAWMSQTVLSLRSFHCPVLSIHITFFSIPHSCKHAVLPSVMMSMFTFELLVISIATRRQLQWYLGTVQRTLGSAWRPCGFITSTQMWLHVRLYSLLITELFISNNLKSVIVYLFLFPIKEMFVNQLTLFIYEVLPKKKKTKKTVIHCNQKVRELVCFFISSRCSCEHIFICSS